jgi:hypothetical protein
VIEEAADVPTSVLDPLLGPLVLAMEAPDPEDARERLVLL